jgi:predicted nucleic acid-binding protein
MLADYKVCIDACVLANYSVSDLLLRLAERPRIYTPVLSNMILDEVRRTHVEKLGWGVEMADSWQAAIRESFPETIVDGFEPLVSCMTNDEKDRHVVAAALVGKAQLIVTFNLKDFATKHLEQWGIEAQHPQDYLIILFEMKPELVISVLHNAAAKHHQTPQQRLAKLAVAIPRFAEHVAEQMGWALKDPS